MIAAHNKCVNGLIADICKYQVQRCALRFVSEDKEKSLKSLWKDKALKSICSQEELWAAAADGERRRNQERQEQEGNELSEEEMEQLRPQRRRSLFGDTTTEVAQARCMNITRSLPVHTPLIQPLHQPSAERNPKTSAPGLRVMSTPCGARGTAWHFDRVLYRETEERDQHTGARPLHRLEPNITVTCSGALHT